MYACLLPVTGPLAEWLGTALQKLLQRFESARDLKRKIAPVLLPGQFNNTNSMRTRIMHIVGLMAAASLIAACFIPWVHYNNINETFTGFHVSRFSTGNYYGRAGVVICFFTAIILLFMFIPKIWAKRTNLFLTAILFAYCIRTYIIFTSALFEGEVEKKAGIYLILILSFLMLASSLFPRIKER